MTRFLSDRALAHLRQTAISPVAAGERYAIGELLGAGGMGEVYLAHDRTLGRDVALKVLALEGASALERLEREAQILARLEHPGIVPVHDLGTLDDGRIYYTMKRIEGLRLDAHVASLGLPERLRIVERIGQAIAFAHAHGIVHRDLKPANVMVGQYGEVLVLDWGVAKLLDEEETCSPASPAPDESGATSPVANAPGAAETRALPGRDGDRLPPRTRPGMVLGTPGYMAPEQEEGRVDDVDRRTDVHALGVLLGEITSEVAGGRPRRLDAIVEKARSGDPDDRYDDAGAFTADLGRFLDERPIEAYRERWYEVAGRFIHRYRTPIALIGTYLLVRALVILYSAE